MESARVEHEIEPVFDERSRVLILGTMPSPVSREAGFFYGHPQNRFWRTLATVFDEPAPETVDDKRDLLLRRRIALWDVLASCDIEGASDASIRNAQPNDLSRIFEAADIRAVFATGTKAGQLYAKLCGGKYALPCTVLPSTSPANAKMRTDDLVAAYRDALLPYLPDDRPPTLGVKEVVALEQAIAASGTPLSTLMRRAGRSLAKATLDLVEARRCAKRTQRTKLGRQEPDETTRTDSGERAACATQEEAGPVAPVIAVLCGFGNNGGDGWVAAEELARQGCEVRVITPCAAGDIKAEPARSAALQAIETFDHPNDATRPKSATQGQNGGNEHVRVSVNPNADELACALDGADAIVDAMLGTGFSGNAVREPFASWIREANARRARGAITVAADVPSGLSAQTGKAADPCIKADLTLTMMTFKPGLITPYAFAFCGDVRVASIASIDSLLERMAEQEDGDTAPCASDESAVPSAAGSDASASGARRTAGDETGPAKKPDRTKRLENREFYRAEAEDDDGYDPYSDRRPEPEPLFQRDPWS